MNLQFSRNHILRLQYTKIATPSQNAPPGLMTTKALTASRQDGTSLINLTLTRVVAYQTIPLSLMLTKSLMHSPTWLIGLKIVVPLTSQATTTRKLLQASLTKLMQDQSLYVWLSTMLVMFINHYTVFPKSIQLTSLATRAVMLRNYQLKTVFQTFMESGTQLHTVILDTQHSPSLLLTGPGTALNQPQWQRVTPQSAHHSTTATSTNGHKKD